MTKGIKATNSTAAAAIFAAGGSRKRKIDIIDEYRPPSGIKYTISQTNLDYTSGNTKILGNLTTIVYDPGQDLSPQKPFIKYAKLRQRTPVWVFLEERIWQAQAFKRYEIIKLAAEKRKKRQKALRLINAYKKLHQYG